MSVWLNSVIRVFIEKKRRIFFVIFSACEDTEGFKLQIRVMEGRFALWQNKKKHSSSRSKNSSFLPPLSHWSLNTKAWLVRNTLNVPQKKSHKWFLHFKKGTEVKSKVNSKKSYCTLFVQILANIPSRFLLQSLADFYCLWSPLSKLVHCLLTAKLIRLNRFRFRGADWKSQLHG